MSTATVLVSTVDLAREDWLAVRRCGIGGSDVGKVMGLSKYGGPLSVYMDKLGLIPDRDPGEAAYWGTVLEDVVAMEFTGRTELKVRRQNKVFAHPDYPWMLANIDRAIVGQNKGLECKTASAYLSDEWKDDKLPDTYFAQVQHYMAVMGWDSCWIAALVGGQRFVQKEVFRNEAFIQRMIEIERDFWQNNVMENIAPEATEWDDMQTLCPEQMDDGMVLPDDEMFAVAEELVNVKDEIKTLSIRKTALENRIKRVVGKHQGMEGICTWRKSKNSAVTDWQAVAEDLGAPQEVIDLHTTIKEGTRRFLPTYKGA